MMRFSNATCYYYEFTAEEAIRHFANSGWDCVELSTEHTAELIARGEKPEKTGAAFIRHAHDLGVDIPQAHLALQCDITDDHGGQVTDMLKAWLELYAAMGVKTAVLHPGGHVLCRKNPHVSARELFDLRIQGLTKLVGFIKDTDMSICLENVGYIGCAEEINELIDPIGDTHLGICLDTGHLNMTFWKNDACLPQYRQGNFIRAAGKRLRATHVHDNDGSRDQHIMPYTYGNVDFREIILALREIGYGGLFNLEIPSDARDTRTDIPYPLGMRYVKSRYLIEMYKYMTTGLLEDR